MTDKELIKAALEARMFSYAPYSNFAVGAAVLTKEGKLFTGCNAENAAYPAGICAERTAMFKAVSEGYTDFVKIAIVGGPVGQAPKDYAYPCGVCRQVMREFSNHSKLEVIVAMNEDTYIKKTLEELLPLSFGPESL